MAYLLKNKNIEIDIDAPLENYQFSRFDWTGKIAEVKFKGVEVSTDERITNQKDASFGKGFYNEFGIDSALGFDEAEIGGWFHKIGVGTLKKEGSKYLFSRNYKIKPAEFKLNNELNRVLIECIGPLVNGYSYQLKKIIEITENGFTINYRLQNTGEKEIITDEYTHNFLGINNALISNDHQLKFPFELQPKLFDETVNPEQKVTIGKTNIQFQGTPKEPFFFSNLTGGESEDAGWTLVNRKSKIGVRETGDFKTSKVNLWGCEHVISPELFYKIKLKAGEATSWSRIFTFFKI